jgi:hypothetical protein
MYYTLYSGEWLPDNRLSGDEYQIKSCAKPGVNLPNRFSQQPPYPVARDCIPQILAGNEPVAVMRQIVFCNTQRHKRMTIGTTLPAKPSEILATAKPKVPLHSAPLRLPVHLLHMVALHSQHMAPA